MSKDGRVVLDATGSDATCTDLSVTLVNTPDADGVATVSWGLDAAADAEKDKGVAVY